jgi:hypothetical protein
VGSVLDQVQELLIEVDYPANKDALLDEAQRRGGNDSALRALRALPPVDYANEAQVLRSIDVDPAENRGQTKSDKNRQARENTQAGRADHMTATEASPIEQEVGSNRGS